MPIPPRVSAGFPLLTETVDVVILNRPGIPGGSDS
jgi:hypothetical protein